MNLSDIKVGDKVRITVEVELDNIDYDGEYVFENRGGAEDLILSAYTDSAGIVAIEKVKAPFKPGDLVRSINLNYEYLLLSKSETTGHFSYYDTKHKQRHGFVAFEPERFEVVVSAEVAA